MKDDASEKPSGDSADVLSKAETPPTDPIEQKLAELIIQANDLALANDFIFVVACKRRGAEGVTFSISATTGEMKAVAMQLAARAIKYEVDDQVRGGGNHAKH